MLGFPIIVDDCSPGTWMNNRSDSPYGLGEYQIEWIVTDMTGNSAFCVQNISIETHQPPVLICGEQTMPPLDCITTYVANPFSCTGCIDDNIQDLIINDSEGTELMNHSDTWCNDHVDGHTEFLPVNGITTCELVCGHNYSMSLRTSDGFIEYYNAWIDYNRDGDFEDEGELIGTSPSPLLQFSFSFTVPELTYIRQSYRMRAIAFFDYYNSLEPYSGCYDGCFGECEDYLITIVNSDYPCSSLIPDYTEAVIVTDDNDPYVVLEQYPEPGTAFTDSVEVTITATDYDGLFTQCTFVIHDADNYSFGIECPDDLSLEANGENCMANFSEEMLGLATLSPTCSEAPVWHSELSPSLPIGEYEVTWDATDEFGNMATCLQVVSVHEVNIEVITCPDNIQVFATDLLGALVEVPLPEFPSPCQEFSLTNDFNLSDNASGQYPQGTTEVVYTLNYGQGQQSACSVNVTVLAPGSECCDGDFNCDGYINTQDLVILINEFGCIGNCNADIDGNDLVTSEDLTLLVGLFGQVCP